MGHLRRLSKRGLYLCVDELRNQLGISLESYPLDPFPVIKRTCFIEYMEMKTKGLLGQSYKIGKCGIIILDAKRSVFEQKFIVVHEYLHLNLQPEFNQTFNCFEAVKEQQDPYAEWQANEGAAEFLIPYKLLIPAYCTMERLTRDEQVQDSPISLLAAQFGVTYMTMRNRISSLSYEIAQFEQGTPLEDIAIISWSQQRSQSIKVTDRGLLLECLGDFAAQCMDFETNYREEYERLDKLCPPEPPAWLSYK